MIPWHLTPVSCCVKCTTYCINTCKFAVTYLAVLQPSRMHVRVVVSSEKHKNFLPINQQEEEEGTVVGDVANKH